jgi:hypothetical protein
MHCKQLGINKREWKERPERRKEEADRKRAAGKLKQMGGLKRVSQHPHKCTVPRPMCCLENPIKKTLRRISMFFLGADEKFL